MKNYKKGLLTVMVLSAMSLMAAEDKTIYVNTLMILMIKVAVNVHFGWR
jgi:hypothetical protein